MHLYRAFLLVSLSTTVAFITIIGAPGRVNAQQTQRTVESVDITGTRRLRKDDILYYVQTRPGDIYNAEQVQRDYQAIIALGFIDKSAVSALIQVSTSGCVTVYYEVT